MSPRALDAIIGESPAIVGLRELIRTIAPTKLPVLIQGPTGSGKELVAAAIHEESGRHGAFVPFNVCAISELMFEDALFGHVRGAFTGALAPALGFLREANGGTVFLDEIGGLHAMLQAKLLRAIDTGMCRPVGAASDVRSDFRVVAATNEDTGPLVAAGRLRADLAFRLSGIVIDVPPLMKRLQDLPLLVRHFLNGVGSPDIASDQVLDALANYDWPGNIRELRHVVERAAVLGGLTTKAVSVILSKPANGKQSDLALRRSNLRSVLETHEWDTDSAARALGVHRATVYRWIRETGLEVSA